MPNFAQTQNRMKQKQMIWVVAALVIFAALTRIMLYPFNFSPVIALALFGGACIPDRRLGFFLPVLAMFVSDLMFEFFNIAPGFWGWEQLAHYAFFVLIAFLGSAIGKPSVLKVIGTSLASSLIFFFLSNSLVWLADKTYYAQDISGWANCLAAGLPFLKNSILADLLYSGLFFGGYALLFRNSLKEAKA